MRGFVDGWYDLVYGSSCVGCERAGRPLCTACRGSLPTAVIELDHPLLPDWPAYVAGDYDGVLRSMVLAHKERNALGLTDPLGDVLAAVVTTIEPGRRLVLVPVPSSRRATRQRGHDPLLRVVRAATATLRAAGRDAAAVAALAQRPRVRDQAGLTSGERIANLEGAHRVRHGAIRALHGRDVALVVCDDVVTTGATAREARRALSAAGLEPSAFVAIAASRRRQSGQLTTAPQVSGLRSDACPAGELDEPGGWYGRCRQRS